MSKTKKHLTQEILNSYPIPNEEQKIVKVTQIRGTNILEVVTPAKENFLCLLPTKFIKTVWVKKGGYLIVEPFEELFNNDKWKDIKLKGRVAHILLPKQIKYLKKNNNHWPKEFDDKDKEKEEEVSFDGYLSDEEEDFDPYLDANPNHQTVSSDSESEEEWEY